MCLSNFLELMMIYLISEEDETPTPYYQEEKEEDDDEIIIDVSPDSETNDSSLLESKLEPNGGEEADWDFFSDIV